MSDIPVIETERLRLRGHTIDDFDKSKSLWSDPDVTTYIGGKPLTGEECWARFLRYSGHWQMLGFGYWLVEEKETSNFVGEVGIANNKRDMQPSLGDMPEVGWVLVSSSKGKGYATEAVNAVLDWGGKHLGKENMCCIIHPEHHASIKVAEKCGFAEYSPATYKGKPTVIFKLQR